MMAVTIEATQAETLVITGMGAVTPIGIGVPAYREALAQGQCGIDAIRRFDASALPVRIAAEVKDFVATDFMPRPLARTLPLFMQYAFAAAQEALIDSRLIDSRLIDVQRSDRTALPQLADIQRERTGIVFGTALAGTTVVANTQVAYSAGHRVGPRFVSQTLGNSVAAHIALAYQLYGPSLTVQTACSAGGDAIALAARLLLAGEADAMLAVGGESCLCPVVLAGLAQAGALSRQNNTPEQACRPFDRHRAGFVMGEGGGALVIETERHAQAREAPIYATLAGWANTSDAYHLTAPLPDGSGAARCMRQALRRAGLSPRDIGYINAHGTSTPLGDVAETRAIQQVFGADAPPVSSTKSMTGHLLGAGGLTEAIACVFAVRDGLLPPTLHLDTPDPQCNLDYIPHTARTASVCAAMSNALGFGGQNSSIIFQRYQK